MKRDAVRKEQDEENDVGERCRKGQMRTKKMAHSQTNIWQHWARERESIQLVCNIRYIQITLNILCYRWHDWIGIDSFDVTLLFFCSPNARSPVHFCRFLTHPTPRFHHGTLKQFFLHPLDWSVCIINCVAFDMILRDGYLTPVWQWHSHLKANNQRVEWIEVNSNAPAGVRKRERESSEKL